MERRFRHKHSGIEVTNFAFGGGKMANEEYRTKDDVKIPAAIIENGDDWEEIRDLKADSIRLKYTHLKSGLISIIQKSRLSNDINLDLDSNCKHLIDEINALEKQYRSLSVSDFSEYFKGAESIKIEDVIGLLRDLASEIWGLPSFDKVQPEFDDFLKRKGLS